MDDIKWFDQEIYRETNPERLWLLRIARIHAITSISEYMKAQRIVSGLYYAPGVWKDYSVIADYQI